MNTDLACEKFTHSSEWLHVCAAQKRGGVLVMFRFENSAFGLIFRLLLKSLCPINIVDSIRVSY